MKLFLFIVIVFSGHQILATDLKYPVSEISEELKTDVNVVVRNDKMVYTIYSQSHGGLYTLYAITIFNEKGNSYARTVLGYDKLTKLSNINGTVYDAAGKQIKKLRSSEIRDQSSYDGFSLFSDDRLKIIDLSQNIFPYTVEIEYEIDTKFLYSIPGTVLIHDEKLSVQHASYELVYPKTLKPHYKTFNIENTEPITILNSNGNESMSWNFENMKPLKFEPFGPYHKNLVPKILAAPNKFEYEGYVGDMSNWESYGKWNLLLGVGRDDLPIGTSQKIKELTKGLSTTEQKAKVVYEYLQSKTRYVNIALGIGGLQPFPASVVDQTGYGDCKALSNYMVAMLKEAGVKSYYTVIMAGDDEPPLNLDFPSHQFNHATVAVPNGADTLWLECTSQTNPFGYQGNFTGDRKALMITESGGKIVNTIRYTAEQNKQTTAAEVLVDKTGSAKAKIKTIYSGLQYENGGLNFMIDRSYDDQKKWVQKNTDIPNFDIISFSMTAKKDKIPSAYVTMDLSLNRFATVSGKRLFVTPNLLNRISSIPEKVEGRKTDVLRKMTYTDLDTIRYIIPEELYPEFLPEPINIESRFGEYHATFKLDQGKVIYSRKVMMKKGNFPPDSYNELIDFYKKINRADNAKLVFLNKT